MGKIAVLTDSNSGITQEQAKELGIPVRLYDDDGNRISPATMMIDDRVSEEYRNAIRGLKFV